MTASVDISQFLIEYERQKLDNNSPSKISLTQEINGIEYIKINSIAKFWNDNSVEELYGRIYNIIAGASDFAGYSSSAIISDGSSISLYYAVNSVNDTISMLSGNLPVLEFEINKTNNTITTFPALGLFLENSFRSLGIVTGIPSIKTEEKETGGKKASRNLQLGCLERIARAMRGSKWFIVVKAFPYRGSSVVNERDVVLDTISSIYQQVKIQFQQSNQLSAPITSRSSQIQSESITGETFNRRAQFLVKALEDTLSRYESMIGTGKWLTRVFFGTNDDNETKKLGAIIRGQFSGGNTYPEPIKTHYFRNKGNIVDNQEYSTFLTADEVALWFVPPENEMPGYKVNEYLQFGSNSVNASNSVIDIGEILWERRKTGLKYQIAIDDLARHGAIFGTTGSGKTTTIMNILQQLWAKPNNIPFLVIEPAKKEYRALLGTMVGNAPTGIIPDLKVYTLGDDNTAPFRINPFEFEIDNQNEQSLLMSHIDSLKSVFNTAFILYAPMPYVLEVALFEVYQDKGWNLATGTNLRLRNCPTTDYEKYPIFPTLTDLLFKVEEVTKRLGYEEDIQQDVIAGLKVRINSLRLGSKGLMMDIPRGLRISDLLASPSLVEIDSIGNDEEKTFLMGILLTRIFEYRSTQLTNKNFQPDKLQHLLVIEEAHRLLKKVNTNVDAESSNLRAQAVESLTNMLAEIRFYGQGILIADQIPSKLSDDVIKNTNLKVIHRLLARDDRDLVAGTMNVDNNKSHLFSILERGEAIIYAEGEDHPCSVKMDNIKAKTIFRRPTNNEICKVAQHYIHLEKYMSTINYSDFGLAKHVFGKPNPVIYQRARDFIEQEDNYRLLGLLVIGAAFSTSSLGKTLSVIEQRILSAFGQRTVQETIETLLMILVLGNQLVLESYASSRGWSFELVDNLFQSLTKGSAALVSPQNRHSKPAEIGVFSKLYLSNLTLPMGPFGGCVYCKSKCSYLPNVKSLVTTMDINTMHAIITSETTGLDDMYNSLCSFLRGLVQNWITIDNPHVNNIAYCAGLFMASALKYDIYAQEKFSKLLKQQLLK